MNYYEVLDVSQNSTEEEIKSAFRKLAAKKHPDKGGSSEEFIKLKTAYDTLKNPLLRKDYDLRLKPESIDSTYNTQYDFETNKEADKPIVEEVDEDYVIEQLEKIVREIRLKSFLNTFGGFFIGLTGLIFTICTLGFIVFSGLINSGFGMMSRNVGQVINPYANLFGILIRSNIPNTEKINDWIKSRQRKSIQVFIIIILLVVSLMFFILTLS